LQVSIKRDELAAPRQRLQQSEPIEAAGLQARQVVGASAGVWRAVQDESIGLVNDRIPVLRCGELYIAAGCVDEPISIHIDAHVVADGGAIAGRMDTDDDLAAA
jgi:hypothetical protein